MWLRFVFMSVMKASASLVAATVRESSSAPKLPPGPLPEWSLSRLASVDLLQEKPPAMRR